MGLRDRLKALITSKHVVAGTFFASMAESTVVPIPLEALLIPAMQANRQRVWMLAGAALLGCVLGALVGYAIGYWLIDAVGERLITMFGDVQQYRSALEEIRRNGFWYVMSIGITPIPFQIAMLAAGAAHYSLIGYLTATLISRGIRYFGLAFLVCKFGNRAQDLFQRHKRTSALVITLIVAIAWVVAWRTKS